MRHVGDLMSSNLRQGKQKEEIGKKDVDTRPLAGLVIGSILSLQFGITPTVFVILFSSSDQLILPFF